MGININVNSKQDYSYLFQSLPGNSTSNLNFLADYASIKNGSYGKLMKAYYAKNGNETAAEKTASKKNSISTAADSAKTLSKIENAADDLKESADKLLTRGSKSVFTKENVTTKDESGFSTTTKEYNKDAIYKAVSAFVEDYNAVIKEAGESNSKSISNKLKSLTGMTESNEKLLSEIGITIEDNDTLSIDKEAFLSADMATAKTLFNGNSSYAYRVSAQASMIDFTASTEASKANTYTQKGNYSNAYSAGNIMDSLF